MQQHLKHKYIDDGITIMETPIKDRPITGGGAGGSSPPPPEFLEVKNFTINVPRKTKLPVKQINV